MLAEDEGLRNKRVGLHRIQPGRAPVGQDVGAVPPRKCYVAVLNRLIHVNPLNEHGVFDRIYKSAGAVSFLERGRPDRRVHQHVSSRPLNKKIGAIGGRILESNEAQLPHAVGRGPVDKTNGATESGRIRIQPLVTTDTEEKRSTQDKNKQRSSVHARAWYRHATWY